MNKSEEKEKNVDQPVVEERKQPGVDTAALTSRWDYGAEGSRVGLLLQMKERMESAKVDFLVVVGGIVNQRAVMNTVRKIREQQVKKYKKVKTDYMVAQSELQTLAKKIQKLREQKNKPVELKKLQDRYNDVTHRVQTLLEALKELVPSTLAEIVKEKIENLAQSINKDLPKLYRSDGSRMKVYIVTSKAYDGNIGREVVKRLLELRERDNDIRYLSSLRPEDTTFRVPLQKSGKTFAVVVANKAVWRSDNYSTYPDRLLQDETKRTSQKLCDVYAVGCFASSINRRDGEIPYQRISIPALHKLEDVISAENMVGFRIVTFDPNKKVCPVLTISFKDFVSEELKFITPSVGCSKIELAIIEEIKKKGETSIGMLEEDLKIPREKLKVALSHLVEQKQSKAGIFFDTESQKYGFLPNWFQNKIRYAWPEKDWHKDVLAGFGCLHGGSVHTAYDFFVNELPRELIANEVQYFLGVGDLIEGLKHDLAVRGEVLACMNNNTKMEKSTSAMVAEVMMAVSDGRLEKSLKDVDVRKLTSEEAQKYASESLMTFLYWIGNHDAWSEDLGYVALDVFQMMLRRILEHDLEKVFRKHGLPPVSVADLIEKKIIRMEKGKPYTLPSGIKVDGVHYYAGRTQTSSTWLQRALKQLKKAQLVWVANFHVAEIVEEWSGELGLRVAMQLPTIKSKSAFEENKGKTTDFGVGLLKVWSHDNRVKVSETSFLGVNPQKSLSNTDLQIDFLKKIGIKYVSLDLLR